VEAALLSDPSNEELLKLKGDLEEVIELTQDLEGEAGELVKSLVSEKHFIQGFVGQLCRF